MSSVVPETLFRDIFSQLPDVVIDSVAYPVNYGWGSQDDLNLFLASIVKTNKYPLIWLIQEENDVINQEAERYTKLMIAKNSQHVTSINPTVWDTEFVNVLNPLFENVLKCLNQSGVTFIVDRKYKVYREANYSYEKKTGNDDKSKAKTIDHWNVITFQGNIRFESFNTCINKIRFN